MANYYLNYEALCKDLNDNLRNRRAGAAWYDERTSGYADCVIDVEDYEAIDIVRCGECDLSVFCRYAPHLGKNGFCSKGMRKEE